VRDDVAAVRAGDLPSADMAWASFPCQDLSLAGWQRGMSGQRSGTFWAFWRLMRDLFDAGRRPPMLVIENVTGLLCGDNFTGLCEALAALQMKFGALVLDARWFVPQSRPRVFLVAVDARTPIDGLSVETPLGPPITKPLLAAWGRLPQTLKSLWIWWRFEVPGAASVPAVEELIKPEPYDVEWHGSFETGRLLDMMAPAHRAKVNRAAASGSLCVGFLYRRRREGRQRAEVRFDGLAGCLRTPGGGSSRQTIVIARNGTIRTRLLSPREAARLMGLPDSFHLLGTYSQTYGAMGDGVATGVVSALSRQLLVPLIQGARNAPSASGSLVQPHSFRIRAESRAALWRPPLQ
jgi:DNA (cytosine-5)-methyltransferase 1